MKKSKKKISSLIAVFILLFSYVSLVVSSLDIYAAPKSSSSSSKTDSGSFSTNPSNKNSSSNESKPSNQRPIFRSGGYYGSYYSPLNRIFYSFRMSSWITKLVAIIAIIVILYIIIDYIRSRRD